MKLNLTEKTKFNNIVLSTTSFFLKKKFLVSIMRYGETNWKCLLHVHERKTLSDVK